MFKSLILTAMLLSFLPVCFSNATTSNTSNNSIKNISIKCNEKVKQKQISKEKKNQTHKSSRSSEIREDNEQKIRLESTEIDILEKIVMAEAGGEPYEGKIAVINVIFNRVNSKQFPNTIKDVVFQKNQFSPVSDKRFFNISPNDEVKKAVKEAIEGKKAVPSDTLFFLNINIATNLEIPNTKKFVKRIGDHWFYK